MPWVLAVELAEEFMAEVADCAATKPAAHRDARSTVRERMAAI